MGAAINSALSTFSDHVFKLLQRVEHRVASNPADREAVFRLRYDAYRRIGFLKPRPDDKLYDPLYDDRGVDHHDIRRRRARGHGQSKLRRL